MIFRHGGKFVLTLLRPKNLRTTALGMPSVLFLVSASIKITVLQKLVSYLSIFMGVRTDSTRNAGVVVNRPSGHIIGKEKTISNDVRKFHN